MCYDQLGCFVSDEAPFYDADDRPVDYLPDTRDELGTIIQASNPGPAGRLSGT